ncbi:MAG TPA: DUF4252 domain-containing protein [Chryseosolibacter sp.]|nr:DUF4252 domain-containing protein [Chryseosolibacter sp.]
MKNMFAVLALVLFVTSAKAQSETTEALQKKYDAQAFFFYNNTLRMLNQANDSSFDELIKDVEKMKFLMIKKGAGSIDYKRVVGDYKNESFEEMMSSRHKGKNFDIFVKEKNNKTTGMLVLINDDANLLVMDIVGSIALNKVTKLFETLDESADFGKKIREFTGVE